jgi:N-acetylmuramoyl-L-alanine amidase
MNRNPARRQHQDPRAHAAVVAACVLLALVVLAAARSAAARPLALSRVKTVVIDPGHGGENLGAIAVDGTMEKVITLAVAERIERLLKERTDAQVFLTRRDDRFIGLRERTRFANQVGADVFLSIHCNSEPGHSGHGIETFLLDAEASDEEAARLVEFENQRMAQEIAAEAATRDDQEIATLLKDMELASAQADSEPLAAVVLEHLVRRTGARSRGVKQAPFAVLKEAEMPAIVVEVGFLSHPEEAAALKTERRQEEIAAAIVDALIRFDRISRYR